MSEAPSFDLAYCYYCRRGAVLRLELWAACDAPVPPPAYPPLEPAYFALVGAICVDGQQGRAPALAVMASEHARQDRALWQA